MKVFLKYSAKRYRYTVASQGEQIKTLRYYKNNSRTNARLCFYYKYPSKSICFNLLLRNRSIFLSDLSDLIRFTYQHKLQFIFRKIFVDDLL